MYSALPWEQLLFRKGIHPSREVHVASISGAEMSIHLLDAPANEIVHKAIVHHDLVHVLGRWVENQKH